MNTKSNKVLVARQDSMGDVLLSGPAIRAIAQESEVTLLCGSRGLEAAKLLPGVADILVWDAPWIANPAPEVSPAYVKTFIDMVATQKFSEAIILTSFHQSPLPLALLLRMAGINKITGASVDYAGSLLDVRLKPGEDFSEELHEVLRNLKIVAAAGFHKAVDTRLQIASLPTEQSLVSALPQTDYVVLHPGADAPSRRWPLTHFVGTAKQLTNLGFEVVVTGNTDEVGLGAEIIKNNPSAIDLTGKCSLFELSVVLGRAEAVIVGNSGPAHLAAAVGTPVVSLFSPVVSATKWSPYGVKHIILGDQDAPCKNTRARICPIPGHPCLTNVLPDQVVRAAQNLINQRRSL